jgi:hypothetical protein
VRKPNFVYCKTYMFKFVVVVVAATGVGSSLVKTS